MLKVCAIVDATCDECAGRDFATDPANCGWCGNVCPDVNGGSTCEDGVCVIACSDGWADCNDDPRDGCETELSTNCGTCAALEGVPGQGCGTCGSGVWACDGDAAVICTEDFGPESYNACGGCEELPVAVGEPCGTCSSGRWACNGADAVACADDAGNAALNTCGGCAGLGGFPGDSCGACGDGRLVCDGIDALRCSDAQPRNSCGGCGVLAAVVGDSCGPCGQDVFVCDGDEAVVCGGSTTNGCGGCAPLEGAPADVCGACEDGVFACEGVDLLVCNGASEPEEINACGGCRPLLREPGESCGACFNDLYVCDGRNGVSCRSGSQGDPRPLTEIGGDLFADIQSDERTLTALGGPYLVTAPLLVPSSTTLIVEPGTLFKFQVQPDGEAPLGFVVYGTLDARGTVDAPIVMTSEYDDCNGGDTNLDGVATRAAPGDWQALAVDSATSRLRNIQMYYAGGQSDDDTSAALRVTGVRAPAQLEALRTWFSGGWGLHMAVTGGFRTTLTQLDVSSGGAGAHIEVGPGGLDVSDIAARENAGPGVSIRAVGDVLALRLTAEDNDGDGLRLEGTARVDLGDSRAARHPGFSDLWVVGNNESRVRGNQLTADLRAPLGERDIVLTVSPNLVQEVVGNNTLENAERGVHVLAGDVSNHIAWPAAHVYTVLGTVEVTADGGLTLPESTIVKFTATRGDPAGTDVDLVVAGNLNIDGSLDAPVTLTSACDDGAGGDTNGDGFATTPVEGDWGALRATSSANIMIDEAEFRFGGGGDANDGEADTPGRTMVDLRTNTAPGLQGLTVTRSQSGGLALATAAGLPWTASQLTVSDNLAQGSQPAMDVQCGPGNCRFDGVEIRDNDGPGGSFQTAGSLAIAAAVILRNGGDGLIADAGQSLNLDNVDARNNAGFGVNLIDGDASSTVINLTSRNNAFLARAHPRLIEQVQTQTVLGGDAIWVTAGSIGHSTTWQHDTPLLVVEGQVHIAEGGRLGIQDGTILKFEPSAEQAGGGILVEGSLAFAGSQRRPITLTSNRQDVGGDTNRDGQASSPARGDWAGVHVLPSGQIEIQYTVMNYAGASFDTPAESGVAAIHIEGRIASFGVVYINSSSSGGFTYEPSRTGDVRITNLYVDGAAPDHYGIFLLGGSDRVELADIGVVNSGHGIGTERDGYVSISRTNIQRVHTCVSVNGPTRGDIYSISLGFAQFGVVFHTCPVWPIHSGSFGPVQNQSPNPCQ